MKGLLARRRPIRDGFSFFSLSAVSFDGDEPLVALVPEPDELAAAAASTLSAQKLAVCRRWMRSEPARLNAWGSVIRRNRFGLSTFRMSTLLGSAYKTAIERLMKLFTSTCPKAYLKCESIHDDVVRHHSQRMYLSHENGSRYLVELDALQKVGHDVTQVNSAAEGVTGALRPVHRRLELGQLIGFQLFARENQSNHMLRKQGKRAQRENFISVLVYKLQHSLHQRLCALVLNVPLCWRQNRVDRVHGDAAGDETNARASQLFQTIVVSRIQQS